MILPVALARMSERRTVRIAILIGLAATLSHALVGDWSSFTHLSVIRDLEGYKGNLFVATTGGIRKLPPAGPEKVYRNTEGLRDVGIASLAADERGEVYAASELGYIYRYDARADDWDILGTSYRGSGWKMSKRALLYRAGYLVLGSEKGLSFFHIAKRVADANVTKLGGISGAAVNSVLFQGDTLFVGTSRGIFKATIHVDKLLTDPPINISNPAIWSQVPGTDGAFWYDPSPHADDSNHVTDSLALTAVIAAAKQGPDEDPALRSHGFLYYGPQGIASEYEGSAYPEGKAQVSGYGKLSIDGQPDMASPKLETINRMGGNWYIGGIFGLYRYTAENGNWEKVDNPEDIPAGDASAVQASRFGVYVFATPRVYGLKDKRWQALPGLEVVNSDIDSKDKGHHAFDVRGPGELYIGSWGSGFHVYRDGEHTNFESLNSCIHTALDSAQAPNYPVIWTQSRYKDKGLWLGIYVVNKPYQVGYYDFSKRTVTCFEPKAKGVEPRNFQVVGDSVLAVVTAQGVEAYRILDAGGSVTLDPSNLLARLGDPGEPILAGKADKFGNFWVTTEGSHLLYVPTIRFDPDTARNFQSLDGFGGTSCKNLEIDPLGHLWAGCREGGIFEITPSRDSLAHGFRRYGLNDGLLSEAIFNLTVDNDDAAVWVTTEKGIARFESGSRPTSQNLSAIKVFPNPFLAKHAAITFDKLAAGSEVQVTTQSGSVVFHRSLASGNGDQIRWDGRNMAGERVREGVYFYVVRSAKELKNGKLIVAR
jgi:ligand-binding sensor domain-containing protein